MDNRKLAGYALGAISLLAVAVAIFALMALITNPSNLLPAALTLAVSIPAAYLLRKAGITLRR
jgi:hypothetical protein